MQQLRISLSADLKRLRDEGYELEVSGGYLLIRHIPYVNSKKEIHFGTLVTELSQSNGKTIPPNNHVIFFIGDHPCNRDGSVISGIRHQSQATKLTEHITVDHSFSNRPTNGYPDHYEKVRRYIDMISAPAISLDPMLTAKTFRPAKEVEEDPVFEYIDTNASRANIDAINSKFRGLSIAIIGLGGTGAYILDQIAKTPVGAIHIYDGDVFLQHNAFRSPGAASCDDLNGDKKKVDYYYVKYSKMHKKIVPHDFYIDDVNMKDLIGKNYIFVCIDKNEIRMKVIKFLIAHNVPCIDVGLGITIADNNLVGMVRVTSATSDKNDHISTRISGSDEELENEYNTNIQIADLNAMNAILAVIKWKKLVGFYQDAIEEHNTTYSINASQLLNEDVAA